MQQYNEFYLTFIRHGESTINQTPNIIGQYADTPLSKKGEVQSWNLGERLAAANDCPDLVFSSTYIRAHDTAKIALQHFRSPPTIELAHDLREYDAGDWTGSDREKTITSSVKIKMEVLNHGFLPPNGESLHQVSRRASKWLEDNILYNENIIAQAAKRRIANINPLNIFCFSHGMTIKCLLSYIVGFDRGFTCKIRIGNCSLTKLYFGNSGWELLGINDCAYQSPPA